MERPTPTTSVSLGPTGDTVRENIRRVRLSRHWTLRDLAEKLIDNGHPIAQSALSKIENGTRKVDVDDLMALSTTLGVSPLTLLLSNPADPRTTFSLTGWGSERAVDAWRWAITGDAAAIGVIPESDSLPWWIEAAAKFTLQSLDGEH
ncbi:helix-turn-helix domain-containing protein [Microbacterium sp. 22296]|uniref:helix-turn-helix domain-containing protein n=1 Tax=Microbacterium sp. 22296 TaxID=3453903 RepID=UPI003F83C9B1